MRSGGSYRLVNLPFSTVMQIKQSKGATIGITLHLTYKSYRPQFLRLRLEIWTVRASRYWEEAFFWILQKVIFHFRKLILEFFRVYT